LATDIKKNKILVAGSHVSFDYVVDVKVIPVELSVGLSTYLVDFKCKNKNLEVTVTNKLQLL